MESKLTEHLDSAQQALTAYLSVLYPHTQASEHAKLWAHDVAMAIDGIVRERRRQASRPRPCGLALVNLETMKQAMNAYLSGLTPHASASVHVRRWTDEVSAALHAVMTEIRNSRLREQTIVE